MNSIDVSPSDGFSHIYNSMNDSLSNANPLVLISLSAIIVVYFIIFSYLGYSPGYSASQQQSKGLKFIEIVMWGLIIFLVLINGIQYFFKIDVQTAIKNLFLGKPEIDIKISPEDGEAFSELMYNYISTKYDLSIFYDSPELAKDLFK